MEYIKAYSQPPRGPLLLGESTTRESVSVECREAALAFMAGVACGGDKLELVLWLTGPYAGATRHVPRGERVASLDAAGDIEDEAVGRLVAHARGELLASLRDPMLGHGALDFVDPCIDRGAVRRAVDDRGLEVWIPVDASRLHLLERVQSLFAADYLNDADGYRELFVCANCEALVFDAGARRRGVCAGHNRSSGIVPRVDGTIPRVVGDE